MLDTTETLNIIQYNVNKSRNHVTTPMFKSLDPERHHILAVQEPWRNPQTPTTSRPPNYHLIYPLSKETRVCFYVSKAINRNEWETTEHSGPRNTHDLSRRQDTAHPQLLQPSTKATHQP